MSWLLDKMLKDNNRSREDFSRRSKMGQVFRRSGVPHSTEIERILALPRRRWQEDESNGWAQLAETLQECYRANEGGMALWPVQAVGLAELHDFGGLFAPVRVGGGKTLLSFLAPTVTGAERPLLLIPAKLGRKTRREFARLAEHWQSPHNLEIMTYELLGRDRGGEELLRIAPDLIIADEGHKLKNLRAGCTRKVRRYLKDNPDTRVAVMSGTITTRSLREYHHLLTWCLPRHMPLPRTWQELQDWADALDEKVDAFKRLAPGALLQFCGDEELKLATSEVEAPLQVARHAFRRRLVETPGVVATDEKELGVSLQIEWLRVETNEASHNAFMQLRQEWTTPDGHPICEAMEVWRHARELACGFYYRWDPYPPEEWLGPRRKWYAFVRETIKHTRKSIDTEYQVAKACKRGELDPTFYDEWQAVKHTFVPNTVPVWIHDAMLNVAATWLQDNRGLCWIEHRAFGERLSEVTGVPFFSNYGLDPTKRFIEDYEGPAIVSIASNSEGRNLQYTWSRNLIPSAPPNGGIWEQVLGRTHREGQPEDEVSCDVPMACSEQWEAFNQACADALYIQDTLGQPQKLCFADKTMPTTTEVIGWAAQDPAWWTG